MNWFKSDRGAPEHADSGSRSWAQSNGNYDVSNTASTAADVRDMPPDTSSSTRAYNPYSELQGLHRGIDSSSLERIYSLPAAPEFLFSEQVKKRRNSAIDYMTYNIGSPNFFFE